MSVSVIDILNADGLLTQYLSKVSTTPWCPYPRLNPKQKLFLSLDDEEEVFLGGAAGGSKSVGLLMAALKYADTPGYDALLLRRSYADLIKPRALMDLAKEWLTNTAAKSIDGGKQWEFPSGATLSFGYLDSSDDKYAFQSAAYQFIGFDELTQFREDDYDWMFSRLRRLVGSTVPLRVRSASNPAEDARGMWVANRFVPDNFNPEDAKKVEVFYKYSKDVDGNPIKRCFIPATLEDNLYIDQAAYDAKLRRMGSVRYAQLRHGDWRIRKKGNIYPMWDEAYHVITWTQFNQKFKLPLENRTIPKHWRTGISQDWGFGHLCVTGCFATAAANGLLPGRVFLWWAHTTNETSPSKIAREVLVPFVYSHNLKNRMQFWLMSQEASGPCSEYNEQGLMFQKWGSDANGGIDRVRKYLEIRNKDREHPFGNMFPEGNDQKGVLPGEPWFYLIVEDEQKNFPTDDRGLAQHRAEFRDYSYYVPRSGEPPAKEHPQTNFNDAMDQIRCYAEIAFPEIAKKSRQEKALEVLQNELSPENTANYSNPMYFQSQSYWITAEDKRDLKDTPKSFLDKYLLSGSD